MSLNRHVRMGFDYSEGVPRSFFVQAERVHICSFLLVSRSPTDTPNLVRRTRSKHMSELDIRPTKSDTGPDGGPRVCHNVQVGVPSYQKRGYFCSPSPECNAQHKNPSSFQGFQGVWTYRKPRKPGPSQLLGSYVIEGRVTTRLVSRDIETGRKKPSLKSGYTPRKKNLYASLEIFA